MVTKVVVMLRNLREEITPSNPLETYASRNISLKTRNISRNILLLVLVVITSLLLQLLLVFFTSLSSVMPTLPSLKSLWHFLSIA